MTYRIFHTNGTHLDVESSLIKTKRFFNIPVLAVRKYETVSGHAYLIDHIPTGSLIADRFYYLSTAKRIATELLEHASDDFDSIHSMIAAKSIPTLLRQYMQSFQNSECKQPPTYQEWTDGPDSEPYRKQITDRKMARQAETTLSLQLSEGDVTLGWISVED